MCTGWAGLRGGVPARGESIDGEEQDRNDMNDAYRNPPAFNVPGVLLALMVALLAIHGARSVLSDQANLWLVYAFGFVPARYADTALPVALPLGAIGDVAGFVTYAFLHGSWMHILSNAIWMLAFGAPVARRFGTARFLVLGGVSAVCAALVHLAFHWGEPVPMIGASGAVSGFMGAAIRFAFTPGGPLSLFGRIDPEAAVRAPAVGIVRAFMNRSVQMFVGIWFVVNIVFGAGLVTLDAAGGGIAWEAHIGGFLAGLLLFRLFDPIRPA